MAESSEAIEEYGVELTPWSQIKNAHAVVLAVAHQHYKKLSATELGTIMAENATIIDVKSMLDRSLFEEKNIDIWRL